MFYALLIGLHIFVAFLIVVVVLMQAAKGGGLSGAFGTGMGSSPLFGAATSSVLVKTTGVLAVIFAITCISLAGIQSRRATIIRGIRKATEEVSTEPAEEEKEKAPAAPEEGAAEEGVKEGVLSPVEAGGEKKEEGAAEGEQPSPTEEKAAPPAKAEEEEKEGAAKSEQRSPMEEKALSPVEAGGAGEESKPAAEPEKESSPPPMGESPSEKR